MPPGSKKRKAAKKKKEQQSNNNPEGVRSKVVHEVNTESEGVNVVCVEKEFKVEDKSNEKDGNVEYKETSSKSYDGGSSKSCSSSSSSSDDESHGINNADSLSGGKAEGTDSAGETVSEDASSLADKSEENKESMVSPSVIDTTSGPKKEASNVVLKIVTISNPNESTLQEKLNLTYDATANDETHHKEDSGVAEPLLAPPPRGQKTSWKGCCGLFEM